MPSPADVLVPYLVGASCVEPHVAGLVTADRCYILHLDLQVVDGDRLYLSPESNERLLSQLARLQPGSRIIAYTFPIPEGHPYEVGTVSAEKDSLDYTIHVWTARLKKQAANSIRVASP